MIFYINPLSLLFFRFELLEILKKNDFKVDVLAEKRSKRKRGKLNLEKAMAKNIFDNEITVDASAKRFNNLFNSFGGGLSKSENDSGNFHKHSSKKSTNSGDGAQKSSGADVILKEV